MFGMTVNAMELPEGIQKTEGEVVNTIVSVTETTEAFEKADTNSAVVATLEKDKQVLFMLKMDNDWCQIMDVGQTMYVKSKYIQEIASNEALSKEMEELEAVRASEAAQDVAARKKALHNRIMGIVIALLIAGVFTAGIVAVIRSDDEEEMQKENREL